MHYSFVKLLSVSYHHLYFGLWAFCTVAPITQNAIPSSTHDCNSPTAFRHYLLYICTTFSQPSPPITSRFILNSGITQIIRLLSCSARLLQRYDLQIFSTKVRCLMGPLLEHIGFYIHGSAFIQNSLLIITTALLYIATVTFSHYKQAAEYCRQTLT